MEIKWCLCLGRKGMTKQKHHLLTKVCIVKAMVFPVVTWELDHNEGWVLKNWCFCAVVLEKTLKSPLDSKAVKPVSPKGNQPWIFTGRTDAEAKVPILATWCKELTHWKRSRCWEKILMLRAVGKGETEDKIVRWQQWLSGHEFEQTPGDSEGWGSPWGHKELDMI